MPRKREGSWPAPTADGEKMRDNSLDEGDKRWTCKAKGVDCRDGQASINEEVEEKEAVEGEWMASAGSNVRSEAPMSGCPTKATISRVPP